MGPILEGDEIMKIFPTNSLFNGCRLWVECDTMSTANSLDYKAEVSAPLITFKKQEEVDPIERDEDGKRD